MPSSAGYRRRATALDRSSTVDFWRRWHKTLSLWLRDYLFIPLGGNRKGPVRRYVNIAITMLLGGLWHGAAWTFLLWGGMHAVLIITTHLVRARFGAPTRGLAIAASCAVTFLLVTLCWVPFRASDIHSTMLIYNGLFSLPANLYTGSVQALGTIALAAIVCWLMPNSMEMFGLVQSRHTRPVWAPTPLWAAGLAILFVASLVYVPASAKFIYFQF